MGATEKQKEIAWEKWLECERKGMDRDACTHHAVNAALAAPAEPAAQPEEPLVRNPFDTMEWGLAAPTPAQPEAGTGKLEDATVINDLDKLVANIRSEDTRGCSTGQANTPASTDDVVERMQRAESELAIVDEALARRSAVALSPNRYAAICAAFNMASRTEKAEAMEKHWKMHYERLAVAREGCYTIAEIENGVREVGGTRDGWPAFTHDLRHYLENELPGRQRLSAGTEREND